VRMVVVGILVVLALGRVLGDVVRVAYPLRYFGYSTNGNGVVVSVPAPAANPKPKPAPNAKPTASPAPAGDRVHLGDRVRIDRIPGVDRKPGIVGTRTFTYDNPDRYLPIERRGEERILHLVAKAEQWPARFTDMLRIVLCVVAVALGAMLFLIKPSIATAAFFVFSLSAVEAPATYLDLVTPMPWRPIAELADDVLRGFVRPALLLFAFCLIDGDADLRREAIFAWFAGALAVALGALNAYAQWSLVYAGQPVEHLERIIKGSSVVLSILTALALIVAFARARANDRHRISWIVAAFVFAGIARTLSEAYFPGHMPFWVNSLLVSATIVPIVTIWIAVLRHQFFNVDFVVSRAVVYASITVAAFGTIWVVEDIGTYLWYNSSNLTYAVFYAISIAIGLSTGKLKELLDHVVDRFIFPDRLEQRQALEFIAGYILDAETVEDVYRALLQDAAHALKLSFGGILARQPDGGYLLAQSYDWPNDFDIKLGPNDELTRAITRTRGALTFSGKDTRMIQRSFPNERLTFVAPLFFDRGVSGIVVYGHNVSGLDLDPDEREHLVRVVAHASIALNTIELNRYRNAPRAAEPLPLPAT
jgi:hypothetical protein